MPETQIEPYIYFPLMSISEAAKYLGVSRSTIYRLIELDEIRAVKQGKATRVEKMSLDTFKESGKLT
ncbi:MAG: helix-turn-helix domain-containing protein [Desulfatirhabdiaceae bacterium]